MKVIHVVAVGGVVLAGVAIKTACGHWPRHEGNMRETGEAHVFGVRRSATARIAIAATAYYTRHDADDVEHVAVNSFTARSVSLVDAAKASRPLEVDWSDDAHGTFKVPEVPDGDYTLHAEFDTSLGHEAVDVPVPLYAPARIHVITDRPLYEPGNTMRFRAVALRARDLTPLDNRPGKWIVTAPDGTVMLEDKAPAGDWGVVAGSFPLDRGAAIGTWDVAWVSGDARDDIAVTVQPFTLPRFRVEVGADKPFYQAGDAPTLRGAVVYSSGAPVGERRARDQLAGQRQLASADRVARHAAAQARRPRPRTVASSSRCPPCPPTCRATSRSPRRCRPSTPPATGSPATLRCC